MDAPAVERHVSPLLLAPSGLAELTFLLPTLEALAASERISGHGTILLPESLHGLAPILPGSPRPLASSSHLSQGVETLRHGGFDEAWALTDEWLPILLATLAGVPRRIGYGGVVRSLLLTHAAPRPSRRVCRRRHRSERFRELLEAFGIAEPRSWIPRLEISEALRSQGLERLRRAHVEPSEETLVGLVVGGPDPNQRWPWQRYATLAQTLRREQPALRFVLLAGARDDLWPSVRVHEETARRNPLVGPDLEPAELAGVMRHLRCVVGADGDLLQLAAAVGAPTVALFGPTRPACRAPRGAAHRIVEAPGGSFQRLSLEPVLEAFRGEVP